MNVEEHFLATQTLVTEEVTYSQDEDGNIMILQDGMYITLTPQQQTALKSLYPNANKISSYYHYVCGYDVLVVDGKFAGELDDALELLAYAYHTGENYTDRDDLEMKYYEHLDYGNERWGFLP